jgi:putative SOS response-associated peptidase YedK
MAADTVERILAERLELLRPYPSAAMHAYRVSTAVNSVKNYGPKCVGAAT